MGRSKLSPLNNIKKLQFICYNNGQIRLMTPHQTILFCFEILEINQIFTNFMNIVYLYDPS